MVLTEVTMVTEHKDLSVIRLQVPNFLLSQVRKLNENSSRRYQFYDKRIKHLLRKIHADSRDKPDKNAGEVRDDPDDPNSLSL